MVKTPDQLKNMTEDYIKTTGVKYQDSTSLIQEKNKDIQWQFLVGQALHITKRASRDDRIFLHFASGFSKEMIEGFNQLGDKGRAEFINEVNEFLILVGLQNNWMLKDKQIIGLEVRAYIDAEEFDRPMFFKVWDNVMSTSNHINRKIALKTLPEQIKDSDTRSKAMYS